MNVIEALSLARTTGANVRAIGSFASEEYPNVSLYYLQDGRLTLQIKERFDPVSGYTGYQIDPKEIINPDGSPVEWEVVDTTKETGAL